MISLRFNARSRGLLARRVSDPGCGQAAAALTLVADLAAQVAQLSTGLRIDGLVGSRFVARGLDAGATYVAGSPLQLLAARRRNDAAAVAEALAAYAAIDHLCARPGIIREVSAPAVAAPPALLITHLLVDLVLAVRHGVRHVVLGYPALGHLVQDVAALHALRALAPQVAPELCDGGTLNLSVTQWSGTAQQVPTSGWAAAAAATMAAGLADATQVVVVPPTADDPQAPDTGLVAGVEFTRQLLDMLADQRLEPSPQLTAECSAIEAEVRAAFASLGSPALQDSPGSPDSPGSGLAGCAGRPRHHPGRGRRPAARPVRRRPGRPRRPRCGPRRGGRRARMAGLAAAPRPALSCANGPPGRGRQPRGQLRIIDMIPFMRPFTPSASVTGPERPKSRVPKASDVIAARLRAQILGDRLEVGTELPSEAELIQGEGFSRSTVREALRLLEADGLIVTKRGPGGGIRVSRPDMNQISRSMAILFTSQAVTHREFLQFRRTIEPAIAALAAEQATDEQRQWLLTLARSEDQTYTGVGASVQFHEAVAVCSNNRVIAAVLSAVESALEAPVGPTALPSAAVHGTTKSHVRIAKLISAGKAAEASAAMLRHLDAFFKEVEQQGRLDVPGRIEVLLAGTGLAAGGIKSSIILIN